MQYHHNPLESPENTQMARETMDPASPSAIYGLV